MLGNQLVFIEGSNEQAAFFRIWHVWQCH